MQNISDYLKDYDAKSSFYYGVQFNTFARLQKLDVDRLILVMEESPGKKNYNGKLGLYYGHVRYDDKTNKSSCSVRYPLGVGTYMYDNVDTNKILFFLKPNELISRGMMQTMLITPTGVCSGSESLYNDASPYIPVYNASVQLKDRFTGPKVVGDSGYYVTLQEFTKHYKPKKGTPIIIYDTVIKSFYRGALNPTFEMDRPYSATEYVKVDFIDEYEYPTHTPKMSEARNVFVPINLVELGMFPKSKFYDFRNGPKNVLKIEEPNPYSYCAPAVKYVPKEKVKLKSVVV